jgi:cell division septation protein DedD
MIEQQQQQPPAQDTEITLGMGKLLAIFFVAVIVCGAFFGMGYSLGKNSTPLNPMGQSLAGISVSSGGTKPTAATVTKPLPPDCATSATGCIPAQNASDTNTTASSAQLSTLEGTDKATSLSSGQASVTNAAVTQVSSNTPTPDLNGAGQNIMVQVAAVTKQEDAEALVNALRKKNYPVFMMGSTGTDKLFHIQVGPFAELKEAEAMKSKLVGDGYNAIVKR